MGLDMYAFTLSSPPAMPVDFDAHDAFQLYYWRKHPDLHGWMERLYREKGGARPDFNCDKVVLSGEDLNRLERDIRAKALPKTTGFFFGQSDGSEHDDDLRFVARAREALRHNLTVFYTCWW